MGKRASSYVNPVSKINIVIFYHIRRQIIIPYPNHLSFDPTEITGGGGWRATFAPLPNGRGASIEADCLNGFMKSIYS